MADSITARVPAPSGERQAVVADVPVTEVTLLEDRGLVCRRGRVTVPPGRSVLRVEGVAPVLVDKTLAADLGAADRGVRVREVKIERWRVTQDADRPEDLAAISAKIRHKSAQRAASEHELRGIKAEVESLREAEVLTLAEIAQDVAWGRQDAARWDAQLDQLGARRRELGEAAATTEQALRRIVRDLSDLQALAAASEHLDAHAAAALEVEFVSTASEPVAADLRLDYVVPGAAWRPWHTARLVEDSEGARIEVLTAGCVWQATGEDWHDVQLVFSTERPSLGVTPPSLQTDHLRAFKRGSAVQVAARDQAVNVAGLGAEDAPPREAVEAKDDLPGIDDGGEALELRARVRASVPTDGRPHRVPIDGFEAPAEVAWVCAPELVPAVLVRSRQTNAGARPLLAGPVDLIRDSGLVGRTSLLFIAPGERFELGWGPDSALRVTREEERLKTDRRTLSSWTRKPRKVTIKLSNIGATPRTIEVKERVAVSEVEKVEVEFVESSPPATPDPDGFVVLSVALPGFAADAVTLTWTLVVHDDVVGV